MIKCGKFLTIKKEGSANQSEGCDARRKAQYGPPAVLCSATLFNYAEMCQRPPYEKTAYQPLTGVQYDADIPACGGSVSICGGKFEFV